MQRVQSSRKSKWPLTLALLGAGVLAASCNQQPVAPEESPETVAPYAECAPHLAVSGANGVLTPGDCIVSPNAQFVLTMRSSGDLELIQPGSDGDTILWSSHSSGGAPRTRHLGVQADGNLVIYDHEGRPVWASGSSAPVGNFTLRVEDAGVAQYISEGGDVVWSVPQ